MTEDLIDYEEQEEIVLYNRTTIFVFSIFLSTIFGGILYYQNLTSIGKKKFVLPLLLFCIVWNYVTIKLIRQITDNLWIEIIVPNMIGGLILSIPFWNYHFKEIISFKSRKVWTPLAIVVLLYGLLIGLNLIMSK